MEDLEHPNNPSYETTPCDSCLERGLCEKCFDLEHCAHCKNAFCGDVIPFIAMGVGMEMREWCGIECAEHDSPRVMKHDRRQHIEATRWWMKALLYAIQYDNVPASLIDDLQAEVKFHLDWAKPHSGVVEFKIRNEDD